MILKTASEIVENWPQLVNTVKRLFFAWEKKEKKEKRKKKKQHYFKHQPMQPEYLRHEVAPAPVVASKFLEESHTHLVETHLALSIHSLSTAHVWSIIFPVEA